METSARNEDEGEGEIFLPPPVAYLVRSPPPPPPPPRHKFGIMQALLTAGGVAFLYFFARLQKDIHTAVGVGKEAVEIRKEALKVGKEAVEVGKDLCNTRKKIAEISEKGFNILDQAASKGVAFELGSLKVVATIQGGYEKNRKVYKF